MFTNLTEDRAVTPNAPPPPRQPPMSWVYHFSEAGLGSQGRWGRMRRSPSRKGAALRALRSFAAHPAGSLSILLAHSHPGFLAALGMSVAKCNPKTQGGSHSHSSSSRVGAAAAAPKQKDLSCARSAGKNGGYLGSPFAASHHLFLVAVDVTSDPWLFTYWSLWVNPLACLGRVVKRVLSGPHQRIQ